MLGSGTTVPRPSLLSPSRLGTCQLPAGAQGSPEGHCALALRRLNSNMKKNLHHESQNRLALSKLNSNLFSSQL